MKYVQAHYADSDIQLKIKSKGDLKEIFDELNAAEERRGAEPRLTSPKLLAEVTRLLQGKTIIGRYHHPPKFTAAQNAVIQERKERGETTYVTTDNRLVRKGTYRREVRAKQRGNQNVQSPRIITYFKDIHTGKFVSRKNITQEAE